jgi:uncharacterized membrane protein YtjA (UPF0391 family)
MSPLPDEEPTSLDEECRARCEPRRASVGIVALTGTAAMIAKVPFVISLILSLGSFFAGRRVRANAQSGRRWRKWRQLGPKMGGGLGAPCQRARLIKGPGRFQGLCRGRPPAGRHHRGILLLVTNPSRSVVVVVDYGGRIQVGELEYAQGAETLCGCFRNELRVGRGPRLSPWCSRTPLNAHRLRTPRPPSRRDGDGHLPS